MRIERGKVPWLKAQGVLLDGKPPKHRQVNWVDEEAGEIQVVRKDEEGRIIRADAAGNLHPDGEYVATEILRGKVEIVWKRGLHLLRAALRR